MGDLDGAKDSIKSHPDFWFIDGSVVLIVEATSFKIHQTVLSRHSDVFADMFTVPQPAGDDTIDGCPVVLLSQDSVSDFVDVLHALYSPFYFDSLPADPDLPGLISFVSGILRFSNKYSIQLLRQKCIDILRRKFPSTLTGCDTILASQYRYISASLVGTITLARDANIPEILPWAFYISTHIEMELLLNDELLSWRDKTMCLAGKERLWEGQKSITHPFLFDFVRSPSCQVACKSCLPPQMGWRDTEDLRVSPHPLERYTRWDALNVCSECVTRIQLQHQAGREKVWEMLPGIFGLGSWEKIHKEQNY